MKEHTLSHVYTLVHALVTVNALETKLCAKRHAYASLIVLENGEDVDVLPQEELVLLLLTVHVLGGTVNVTLTCAATVVQPKL